MVEHFPHYLTLDSEEIEKIAAVSRQALENHGTKRNEMKRYFFLKPKPKTETKSNFSETKLRNGTKRK
jgi:hypothetical protein